jgi:hypothetical protein
MMAYAPPNTLFDEILDFITSTPTPEQIIAFQPSEQLNQRLHELLDKKGEDVLTADEQKELDEFLRMGHFMNMAKSRARQKLAKPDWAAFVDATYGILPDDPIERGDQDDSEVRDELL